MARLPETYRGARRAAARQQKLIWRELPRATVDGKHWLTVRVIEPIDPFPRAFRPRRERA